MGHGRNDEILVVIRITLRYGRVGVTADGNQVILAPRITLRIHAG